MKIIEKIAVSEAAWLNMTKRHAFANHLLFSGAIVTTVFAVVFLAWYPQPYFEAVGTWSIIRILIGVDLVVGPLLTLIVYRPGKRLLALDLVVIAIIQISALFLGVSVLHQERPYYTVFAIDRFVILAEKDIQAEDRSRHDWMLKPTVGPMLATAKLPESIDEQQRLMDETVFEGAPDIERRPELWHPYADDLELIRRRANSLSLLRAADTRTSQKVDRIVRSQGVDESELGFFPISSAKHEASAIVNLNTGSIIAVFSTNPWDLI